MAMKTVDESGMRFGPFDKENLFEIEKSELYRRIENGVKVVEFIFTANDGSCYAVEAKSSSPRPGNHIDFKKFISEIEEKFSNTLMILLSSVAGRHDTEELPHSLMSVDAKHCQCKLFLVIKGHKKEWLHPIQDAMNLAMNRYIRTCGDPRIDVLVINDEIARSRKLIR